MTRAHRDCASFLRVRRQVHDGRTMSRTARLLVILAAWTIPVVWVVAELGTRPSDGTVVWSSPLSGGDPWGSAVTVRDTYGETLLRPGDVVETIDGRPVDAWLSGHTSRELSV